VHGRVKKVMSGCSGRITNLDQRSYIKIETIRGRTPTEIHKLLKEVCGDDVMDRSTISRWSAKFKEGRISIEDDPRAKTSPRPSKFRRQQTKMKQMLIMAYDFEGILACYRVPKGTTVNGEVYAQFLRKQLRPKIRKLRPQLLESGVLLLHDNARPHLHTSVNAVLAEYRWESLPHPPYSPDMSPCDYDLFCKLKQPMRGSRYPSLIALNSAVTRRIRELNFNRMVDGVRDLPNRWKRVIEAEGDYIERRERDVSDSE
jgi:transposase